MNAEKETKKDIYLTVIGALIMVLIVESLLLFRTVRSKNELAAQLQSGGTPAGRSGQMVTPRRSPTSRAIRQSQQTQQQHSRESAPAQPIDDGRFVRAISVYEPQETYSGYNIFTDDTARAYVMDMKGNIVHRWRFPSQGTWDIIEPLPNGRILTVSPGERFAKFSKDSKVTGMINLEAYEDIEVLQDGTFLVIIHDTPAVYEGKPVINDGFIWISRKGTETSRWMVLDHIDEINKLHGPIEPVSNPDRKGQDPATAYDLYVLNTVESLPKTELGIRDARFKPGNIMVSLRNAGLILILDPESKKIVWSWGQGELDHPDMPTMLWDGNILVFDSGTDRGYSRVIEVEPDTGNIVWEYKAATPETFFSPGSGYCQRLPNGNTLITEASKGHVFEITTQGNIVWDFQNPNTNTGKPRPIRKMVRTTDLDRDAWLKWM